jgi:membrane protease YdiL (CAAX protease family)
MTGAGTWPRLVVGFAVLYGVLAAMSGLDGSGRHGLAVLAAVVVAAVLVERVLFHRPWAELPTLLGLRRPGVRAVAAAAVVSALVLLVFPLFAAVSGAAVHLRPDWPWLLVGVFAMNGLAEELVWRGFAFRRLRQGRSFGRAVWLTMPLVAGAHVPILLSSGPAVGLGAMVVAAVTAVPFSCLYEEGRRTIWAPALLHTAIDSFKLVEIPAADTRAFSLTLVAVSIVVPLVVLVLPGRRPPRRHGALAEAARR